MKEFLGIAFILISIILSNLSAKCINQIHIKMKTLGGEETKQYKCSMARGYDRGFNENQECINCGCPREYHDDERSERRSQERERRIAE